MARKKKDAAQSRLFAEESTGTPPLPAATAPTGCCHVHWLDARCGILSSAADWLLDQVGAGQGGDAAGEPIDCSVLEVVVPGRAAGHRLVEILVDRAAALGRHLVPPRTVTLGALPERLYRPARPLADPFTETLCWVSALAAAKASDRHLVAPGIDPPAATEEDGPDADPAAAASAPPSPHGLLDAARMLVTMHRELAANALSFADLAAAAEKALPAFADHARWEALARLERTYLTEIDGLGFWDRQTARRVAVEHGEVDRDERLVLLATVDIDPLQRRLLAGVRGRIDALVAVPEGLGADPQACFDDFGCIVPEAWLERTIPVALSRIEVVDDAEAQAAAVVDWIGRIAARRASDEITVAVPDAALVPVIEEHLATRGLSGRYAAGRTCVRSSPWQLAHAVFEWLARREFQALADLLRCPDCVALVRRETGVEEPTALADAVATRHLPWRVDRDHLAEAGAGEREREENATFLGVLDAVDRWLEPLRAAAAAIDAARTPPAAARPARAGRAGTRRSASDRLPAPRAKRATSAPPPAATALAADFVRAVRRVLGDAIDGIAIDRDDETTRVFARSLAAFGEVLAEAETVPDRLVAAAGSSGFARLLLASWGQAALPPAADPTAIDLVGWLEVALDDAPALAITACVEGSLPGSASRDPLLPEPLRQALGLDNASRTAARDAWMLAVAASREDLLVVVPRKGSDGAPTVPSRLLFRRDPDEVVVAARRWFARRPAAAAAEPPRVAPSRLLVPQPPPPVSGAVQPPMRVTEFRDYLACPYRYWLRHRLHLAVAGDDEQELGAQAFGTLVHECLDRFAHDVDLAASGDADRVADGLSAMLDRLVAERYGAAAVPAVSVQAELARRRLRAFARVQAWRTAQGWRIHSTERSVESKAFVVDGVPVRLAGRIDRIDHHPGTDAWQVLDYKTSQRGRTPEQTHRDRSGWIDLQLPLYRHLLAEVPGMAPSTGRRVGVGYFNVPARIEEIRVEDAPWTEDDYASADEAAARVVRDIRAGIFWPPVDDAAGAFPEFDALCQTRAIRDDEEGES